MKHKIQVILVLILLLLLVVVIIVIVIIIVVNRTRGAWSWCGDSGGGGASAVNYNNNNHPQDQRIILVLIVLAVTVIMLAVIWFKLSQIIHKPIVNRRNIVQKYYQKYRKQFLRLCCCSYHVPPGPGPGGGTVICSSIGFNSNNRNSAGIMISTDNGSDIGATGGQNMSGNCGNTNSSGNVNTNFTNSTTMPNSSGSSNNNCRKTMAKNRRRRSLSGGLVWLLIGLVWLEGPLLISCKMNSSGEHMIKINSNTNRIIGSEQQNKKFDILNNNKRYNKVYSKNSLKIGGGSSPNSSNNSGTGSGAGSGGPNGGGGGVNNSGKNSQKNNYSSKNKSNNSKGSKYRNNLGQSGKTNSDGGDTDSRSQRNQRSTSSSSNSNTKRLHNAITVSSGTVNDNYNTVTDRGTDNNYFRYSNHYYHYMDPNDHHHHHNHHTPVHLADEPPPPAPPSPSVRHGTEQKHHQNIDEVDKRSILASIGCPNCVFNSYNSPSKTAFISSTETFPPPAAKEKLAASYNRQPAAISHLSTDMIRLESIKRQILSKLGMKTKPNVTHPLPKQFIMDTLYRADGSNYVGVNFGFHSPPQPPQHDDDFNSDFSVNDGYDGYPSDDYAGNDYGRNDDGGASVRDSHDRRANIVLYNSSSAANIVVDVSPSASSDAPQYHHHHHHKNHHVSGGGRPSLSATESELLSSHSYQYQKNNEENHFADMEDFFGSTKEIITFAERGRMFNGHRLIEFPSPADQVIGQHLQIRSAAIWIRIETRQQQQHQNFRRRTQQQNNNNNNSNNRQTNATNLTIWVFQLSGDDLKNKEFDDLATLSTSLNVKPNQLGWQKLDITETIRQWYGRGKSEKLRLLIDCTGCGHRYNLHLFQQDNSKHTHTTQMSGDDNQFFTTTTTTTTSASDQQQNSRDHHHHHKHNHNHHANSYTSGSYDSSSSSGSSSYNRVHRKRPPRNRKGRSHIRYGKILGQSSQNRHRGKTLSSTSTRSSSSSSAGTSSGSGGDVDPNRPFLVIHTDPNRVRRVRRRAVDCSGAINGQCCKESFYVSFKALGWDDWIIAPHGYFANYCRGDCGGPHRTPDTFQSYHTHVMEEFRKMDRLNGMQPCCAPLKFSSMSLIYYGNEGIIKRDLPKMVVDECGCP